MALTTRLGAILGSETTGLQGNSHREPWQGQVNPPVSGSGCTRQPRCSQRVGLHVALVARRNREQKVRFAVETEYQVGHIDGVAL